MRFFYSLIICLSIFTCEDATLMEGIVEDYEKGLKIALKENKKILLVFDWKGNPTGSSLKLLSDKSVKYVLCDYVVIFLYVDGVRPKVEFNKELQKNKYGSSFQPAYYLLNPKGETMIGPQGYCKEKAFIEFLNSYPKND